MNDSKNTRLLGTRGGRETAPSSGEVPTHPTITERETLGARIAEIDAKLDTLRPRLRSLLEEIRKLIDKENHLARLFADADQKDKKKIDKEYTETTGRRVSLERECKGLAIASAELEDTRAELYPAYQALVEAEQREERKRNIEELRKQHERDQVAERQADRALVAAREKSNKSYFRWRAEIDQEALAEMNASLEKQKEQWAKNSGPNAPHHQRGAS